MQAKTRRLSTSRLFMVNRYVINLVVTHGAQRLMNGIAALMAKGEGRGLNL